MLLNFKQFTNSLKRSILLVLLLLVSFSLFYSPVLFAANSAWTGLMRASFDGDTATVTKLLLDEKVKPNEADNDGRTALMLASYQGHTEIVIKLLEKNANPNQANKEGGTALIFAPQNGHTEVVTKLLEKGADPNQADKSGWTALMEASKNGCTEIVIKLLENGADPNQAKDNGRTALVLASKNGHTEIVTKLLEKGADPNQADKSGWTALMEASKNGYTEIVIKLLENGADPNQASNDRWHRTALDIAADNNHTKIVELLRGITNPFHQGLINFNLGLYADKFYPEEKDFFENFKNSPGHCHGYASLWLYTKWVECQSKKPSIYDSNWFKNTIKTINKWDGVNKPNTKESLDIEKFAYLVDFLQNRQFNLDISIPLSKLDTDGKILKKKYTITLVLTLEQKQKLSGLLKDIVYADELIEITYYNNRIGFHALGLFKHGKNYYYYDPNSYRGEIKEAAIDRVAETIFNSAKSYNDEGDAVMAFSIYGFDDIFHTYPDQKEFLAKINTPIYNAEGLLVSAYTGAMDSLLFFLDHGLHPNATLDGRTALIAASQNGHTEIVTELLKRDANPNQAGKGGGTALILASQNGHTEVVTKLLEKSADPNKVDKDGWTALMASSKECHTETVIKLLENGADPNKVEKYGWTALMLASQNGHTEVVTKLLEKGADPRTKNIGGANAIVIAESNGHMECANILRNHKTNYKEEL